MSSYTVDIVEYVNDEPIYFDVIRDKLTRKVVFYRAWYLDNEYSDASLESIIEDVQAEYESAGDDDE